MAKNYFFITGLPRSGTAWLANYLSYGKIMCLHDGFRHLRTPDSIKSVFDGSDKDVCGNSDPANLLFLSQLFFFFPKSKWIYIERDPKACEISWAKLGGTDIKDYSQRVTQLLRRKPDTMVIKFESLFNDAHDIGKSLCPDWHCPSWRTEMLQDLNVQQNFERSALGMNINVLADLAKHVEPIPAGGYN